MPSPEIEEAGRQRWEVYKFGGSSVKDAEAVRRVASIIARCPSKLAVVVSATGDTTDYLQESMELARDRHEGYNTRLQSTVENQRRIARDLLNDANCTQFEQKLTQDESDLKGLLHAAWLCKHGCERSTEFLLGYGELWSAWLLATVLRQDGVRAEFLDARDFMIVSDAASPGGCKPLLDEIKRRLAERLALLPPHDVVVITGFVASQVRNQLLVPCTLGRNGSDYSATIIANVLDARQVTMWKDVDGLFSADPRTIAEARLVRALSYEEVAELTFLGSTILHPHTMAPAVAKRIPILIRNTFKPEEAVVCKNNVAIVELHGASDSLAPNELLWQASAALRNARIAVLLLSQIASSNSVSVVVNESSAADAEAALKRGLLPHGTSDAPVKINAKIGYAIVSLIGSSWHSSLGTFVEAVHGTELLPIAAMSFDSPLSVSACIESRYALRALQSVHRSILIQAESSTTVV